MIEERQAILAAEFQADERKLVAQLNQQSLTFRVGSVEDLMHTDRDYPQAIPVLVDHLRRPHIARVLEVIGRALIVPQAMRDGSAISALVDDIPVDTGPTRRRPRSEGWARLCDREARKRLVRGPDYYAGIGHEPRGHTGSPDRVESIKSSKREGICDLLLRLVNEGHDGVVYSSLKVLSHRRCEQASDAARGLLEHPTCNVSKLAAAIVCRKGRCADNTKAHRGRHP